MSENSIDSNSKSQNVQRLEGDAFSKKDLPLVLGDLISHEKSVLKLRESFKAQNIKYKGNTKELLAYKQALIANLSSAQMDWCVGLTLGDSSIQANNNLQAYRIKMQQSVQHIELINASTYILLPWVLGESKLSTRKSGTKYVEFQTIAHASFNFLADLFQDPTIKIKKNGCVSKVVPKEIESYLSPIGVAAWFCSDGGRRDYGKNEGKAIQFHTQGFNFQSCEHLASALTNRYNWDIQVRLDYKNESKNFYLIQVEASSFESFLHNIEGYILPSFKQRLPSARKPATGFGSKDSI
jgi:hypothetical protein